jgi:aminoglycoside phosphotransferase (APT) family kinase protein
VPDGINAEKVTAWLDANIAGLKTPLTFSLIAGGHSNLTYRFVDANGAAFVLRRPPLGHVLESAHDMGREHKIVSALQGSKVPVAEICGLCKDTEVNEAPFYVMRFVDGVVFNGFEDTAPFSTEQRGGIAHHVVEILADLHAVDPDAVGLGDLGRKEAYLARQLKRWTKQWEATKTDPIPEMDECARRLADLPEQVGASIVHGDYRVGNMIFSGNRVQAVLDWELCTLGDPLADVGYLLNSWIEPGEEGSDEHPIGSGGFLTREIIADAYAERTGRDLSRINYYRAFQHWRLAAISQGVYKRYLVGAMGDSSDIDLDAYKAGVVTRAQAALELL